METDPVPTEKKRAETTTQLEIDEAILDYLAYKATKSVLLDVHNTRDSIAQESRTHKCALLLDLVDSFLVMFHDMHPGYQGTQELQLRLRLLSFATLFARRQSSEGPGSWTRELWPHYQETIDKHGSTINVSNKQLASFEALRRIENHVLWTDKSKRATGENKPFLPWVSLLDSLPSFMALSAAENAIQESKITNTWMRLAAGYMAQAVIEQYLLYGSHSDEVLDKAFAWGFDSETEAKEGSEDWLVNAMFFDEEAEFQNWQGIRDEHMLALIPPVGRGLLDHFTILRESELPLSAFEHAILNFLEGLLHNVRRPTLVQVESGMIEDCILSQYDTQMLKERVGII